MTLPAQSEDHGASLFPILPAGLSGLAKMAAESEHSGDGHLVEFRAMEVRGILNKSVSKRQLSLEYSINPYRGCEFGCKYCYARYAHGFLAPRPTTVDEPTEVAYGGKAGRSAVDFLDPLAFERVIFLKQNAAWLLEQELRRTDPAREIALGTATDPYQPVERRARITRSLLEVFARRTGHRLGIVTKSTLIARDIDLLAEIARRNTLVVHVTITTADAGLARKLEPRAPRPDLRFATVKRLREAGITAGVLCSPLLPGITDSDAAIDGMARLAKEADASFFAASPLFLKACSRPTYLSFVREHFPALVAEHERRFGTADFAAPNYRRRLAVCVLRACLRHGLRQRSNDALLTRDLEDRILQKPEPDRKPVEGAGAGQQRRLFA